MDHQSIRHIIIGLMMFTDFDLAIEMYVVLILALDVVYQEAAPFGQRQKIHTVQA